MNTTAHADQIHATLRDARCCDALDPCDSCRSLKREYVGIRHAERVARGVVVPAPRSALAERLGRARMSA